MKLVSKVNIITAFVFGLLAYLIVEFEIFYYVSGSRLISDPREIFVLIGSALTGPVGGLIIGIISTLSSPVPELYTYTMLQHIFGGVLIGLLYRRIYCRKINLLVFIFQWVLLAISYYFIFYIPLFLAVYFFDNSLYQVITNNGYPVFHALYKIYKGFLPEFIITTVITSLVMIALPENYIKPLWGSAISPLDQSTPPKEKGFLTSTSFKNILPVRLIAWFILLAIIPILFMAITIKKDVINSHLQHESVFRHSIASSYKEKFYQSKPRELVAFFKEIKKTLDGDFFIINSAGNYALNTDSTRNGKNAVIDYPENVINTIIKNKNGNFIDYQNLTSYGFSTYKGTMHELIIVSVSNRKAMAAISAQLENDIYNKLIFGLFIISAALIFIVWLLVRLPLSRFRSVITAFSNGSFDIRVPVSEMNDEIKVLARSFNDMADNLININRSLEKEIREHKEAEIKLSESEDRWKFALEGAGDGLWDWNAKTNEVFFSKRWKQMLGYDEEEISSSLDEWLTRVHPDDKEKCLNDLKNYQDGKTPSYQNEHRMKCKDGSYKWILDRGRIIERDEDGQPLRMIGTHTDIDWQKKIILELENRNVFIQTILDNLPIGLAVNEIESGKASYVNKKFTEVYGWSTQDISDITRFFELVYPDPVYRKEIFERIMSDITSGDPARMKWENIRITTEQGEERFVSAVNIPIIEQNIMVSTVQDVTLHNLARQKILDSNKNLKSLLEVSNTLSSSLELDKVLQLIIDSIISIIGLDSGAIYTIDGDNLYLEATTPALSPEMPDIYRRAILSEHSFILKCVNERDVIYIHDISKVELSPAEKRVVETRGFRTLIFIPLIAGNEILAVSIIGTMNRVKDLPDSEIELCKAFSNIAALAISNARLFESSKKNLLILKEEIRERELAELALRKSEKKYRDLFESNRDGITIFYLEPADSVSGIVEVNRASAEMLGYSKEEVLGIHPSAFEKSVSEEDIKYRLNEIMNNGFCSFETILKHREGNEVNAEITTMRIDYNNRPALMNIVRNITDRKNSEKILKEKTEELDRYFTNALDLFCIADTDGYFIRLNKQWENVLGYNLDELNGKKFLDFVHPDDLSPTLEAINNLKDEKEILGFSNRYRTKSGEYRVIEWRAYPSGNRIYAAARDITERILYEEKITNSLKEKEILLKEVHHRVKNNFQVIMSLLSLQSELIEDQNILNAFRESRNRIKSMALIHELLYRESNFESIDINHYIKNMVDFLKRSYTETKGNINIRFDVDNIQMDIDTIIPCGLIINELISNSFKHAFPDGRDGEVLISFKRISEDSICLLLKDNGIGITGDYSNEDLKSLGMMLVNTLTKQLNGELYIAGNEKGSEFRIIFHDRK